MFYHTSADDLAGPTCRPGVNFKAENLETLYLGYIRWHLPENFAIELAMGYPPLAKIKGSGPATVGSVPYNGQVISSARWIAPTLLFEYNFLPEFGDLRPYIGVGVNYTTFYDRDSTAAGNAASGGPTRISLDRLGGARRDGRTDLPDQRPLASARVLSAGRRWRRISPPTPTASIRTSHISFGPQALIVSVGYSFGR